MTPEEIAQRHSSRPGFHLESYGEVALPYWRLVIRAHVLEKHKLGPLSQFTLRAVSSGVDTPEEISSLLGLDGPVLDAALVGLLSDNDVALAAGPLGRSEALSVTQKGARTLTELGSIIPTDVSIEIHYDGLLRKPVPFVDAWLAPKDIKSRGLREIPPARANPPGLDDLSIDVVQGLVRRLGPRREALREILALKKIEERRRFFQPAIALVYRSNTGAETQVDFVIGDRLSEVHGEAFEQAGLKKKIGIAPESMTSAEAVGLEVFGADVVSRADTQRAAELQATIIAAEQALPGQPAAITVAPAPPAEPVRSAATEARVALDELPVRPIETFEHPKMLAEALDQSRSRIVIVSPWIRRKVVNKAFVSKLELRLKHGVEVFIGWGMAADTRDKDIDEQPKNALEQLAARYPNFKFEWFGNTHAKVLISDSTFAVATSFNWLSFKGDPNRTFRDERGMLVRDPTVVEVQFQQIRTRFDH